MFGQRVRVGDSTLLVHSRMVGVSAAADIRAAFFPVNTPVGGMMIGVLGSLGGHERELIRERTTLKRQASRANGTKFGRRYLTDG